MKITPFKKIICALLIALVIIIPMRSNAQWEVTDPGDIGVNVNTTVQDTLTQVDNFFGHLKTFGLDGLAYGLAQMASQKLVSSVLNAVNGGASANKPPNYVGNYAQYFASLGGKTTTNYYNSLQYSKNPFAAGIAQGIANTNSGFSPSGLNAFNLNTILNNGTSWQSAATNLGTAGVQGFDFYNGLAFPQNTPLGSNLIAQQQLGQNLATAQNLAKIQLTSTGYKPQTLENTGKGIFANIGAKYGVNTNSLINASQQAAQQQQVQNGLNNATANGPSAQENAYANLSSGDFTPPSSDSPPPCDTNCAVDTSQLDNSTDPNDTSTIVVNGQQVTIGGHSSSNSSSSGTTYDAQDDDPEDYSGVNDVGANITTPSATTSDTVNKSTQEAQARLQNSDQFFKLVFSTLTQLVTGLINKGISSLRSDAGHASQYQYGSPASVAAGYNGSGGSWASGPQTIVDFKNDLGDANQKTALDVQYDENILNLLKAPVTGTLLNSAQIATGTPQNQGTTDVLQKLEACIPGPDTGWDTRLQDYANSQLSITQSRGNGDSSNAPRNQQVYKLIQQEVTTAIQEEKERVLNPFLNIPAATEMSTVASDFYANSQKFQGIFSTLLIKRQVSEQLATIIAQVKAFIPTLVLFDDQWQTLTQSQKDALYTQLSPQILADSIAGDFTNTYTTTDAAGNTILTPITPIHPLATTPGAGATTFTNTAIDNTAKHNNDEEARILDEQWQVWETDTTHITEAQRQTLYAQFESVKNSVTDATSLQNTKTTMDSISQQNTDLADALHDCLAIRTATQNYTQYTTQADWDTFKNTLYSDAIKAAFLPNTSIIAVANGTAGIDFSKEGDITLPLNKDTDLPTAGSDLAMLSAWVDTKIPNLPIYAAETQSDGATSTHYLRWADANNINRLQVQPAIPLTTDTASGNQIGASDVISALFDEDATGSLFCRLPSYTLNYWIPNGMTGLPIGCFDALIKDYSSSGTASFKATTKPNWYHINRAQIYYNLSNPTPG